MKEKQKFFQNLYLDDTKINLEQGKDSILFVPDFHVGGTEESKELITVIIKTYKGNILRNGRKSMIKSKKKIN